MHQPVIELIDLQVEGSHGISPFYKEVFKCARNAHGDDRKRFRVVISPSGHDRYVDVWSRTHDQWHRVHSMKWGHPLAEVKAAEDLYKGGKYQASDFKACRDELVRVALGVVCG